jgi:hypothetical protein
MGIKDLMNLLRQHAPASFRPIKPSIQFTDVWIDTPLLVMAHYKKCQSMGVLPFDSIQDSIQKTVHNFRKSGIPNIHFVFDGKTREAKFDTVIKRITAGVKYSEKTTLTVHDILRSDLELSQCIISKSNTHAQIIETTQYENIIPLMYPTTRVVSSNTIDFIQNLCLSDPDISVYIAPHDSEEYIAKQILSKPDTLSLISSIDSDVLAFGIPHVVQYFGTIGENWFCLDEILKELNITIDQFRWMCVLLGNDFNPRLKGKGPAAILPSIRDPAFNLDAWAEKHKASDEWIAAAKKSYSIFSLQ